MADIRCPKCKELFDMNNPESFVTRDAAFAVGAGAGAWFGAEIGIVGGPVSGIAGTIPGAIVGGVTGWFVADQFRRCRRCGKIFKT
jgi:phage tail tape-measure protein